MKTKQNWKWKIPHTVIERRTLCFSSYKNLKLKVTLWWVGVCERKKREFFVPFILSEQGFFIICVFSHIFSVFSIEYTFRIYIKKYCFILFCCLFLESLKAFSVSLTFISLFPFNCLSIRCNTNNKRDFLTYMLGLALGLCVQLHVSMFQSFIVY